MLNNKYRRKNSLTKRYCRIAIIGLGTLGGFVAQTVSELNFVRKIVLVDFDIVENHNLTNSIYRNVDVNKYKTTSLHNIIKEQCGNNLEIEIITEKYEESKTVIPQVDLIIDCRDYVCDRNNEIDVRLFVSSRYLVIDCRKNVSYDKNYTGRYLSQLTKNDLRRCSLIISSFMQNDFLDYMMKDQLIKEIDLDYMDKISSEIKNNHQERNMIVDYEDSKKLLNLEENIGNIICENQNKDLMITVGDKRTSPLSKVIKKNSLKDPKIVVNTMNKMINTKCTSQFYYIISVTQDNNMCYVELLPETGAA